jgi:hypothetical protein
VFLRDKLVIFEALKELGQMIQGHPEAQVTYQERIAELRTSVNNLVVLRNEYQQKGLVGERDRVNALIKQQQTELESLEG